MQTGLVSVLVILVTCCVFSAQPQTALTPTGMNVCSRRESFAESFSQAVKQSYTQRISKKCKAQVGGLWNLYKICYENRVLYRTVYRQIYREAYRTVYLCCVGWAQSGNNCSVAICPQGCVNGKCGQPNQCTCHPGYYGTSCNLACQANRWGPGCNNTCLCQNNAACDMRTGACNCTSGWQGVKCDLPCNEGFYGNQCKQSCDCENGARCHHVTGNCTCKPGWIGHRCNKSCAIGYYGDRCQEACDCLNKAKCDHVTGKCTCAPGWQGLRCNKPCDPGFYGNSCQSKCQCVYGSCDHVKGTCSCHAGNTGVRCDKVCPEGSYGINCAHNCTCSVNQNCSHISGECACKEGYTGPQCTIPCIAGSCSNSCPCASNATCDRKEDTCVCLSGFTGESCDQSCPVGFYGNRCLAKCTCRKGETCNPMNGTCTCTAETACRPSVAQRKDKQTGNGDDILVPGLTSGLVILLLLAVAIGYLFYRRRNQRTCDDSKAADQTYEIDDAPTHKTKRLQTGSSCGGAKSGADKPIYMDLINNKKSNDPQNPSSLYQPLDKGVAMTTDNHYTGLTNPGCDTSEYQPLDRNSRAQADQNLYENGEGREPLYMNTKNRNQISATNSHHVQENEYSAGDSHDIPVYLELINDPDNDRSNPDAVTSQDYYENQPDETYVNVCKCDETPHYRRRHEAEAPTYEVLPPNEALY